MPTPSELQHKRPRRSVFGNYPEPTDPREGVLDCGNPLPLSDAALPSKAPDDWRTPKPDGTSQDDSSPTCPAALHAPIDRAMARSFIHRFAAKVFEDPESDGWFWLTCPATLQALTSALEAVGMSHSAESNTAGIRDIGAGDFDSFATAYVTCFGHTVRGDCPMNEIEYGDIKADPLFQPHRLADLGAFYSAFGLEVGADAAERIDHISIELEFLSVLAAKEAYALEHQFDVGHIDLLRDAQRKFLREHLGRWTPAFSRRLAGMSGKTALGRFARLLGDFIKCECAHFNIPPGSEDLLLRPADAAGESLCASCGITNLPPGALATA